MDAELRGLDYKITHSKRSLDEGVEYEEHTITATNIDGASLGEFVFQTFTDVNLRDFEGEYYEWVHEWMDRIQERNEDEDEDEFYIEKLVYVNRIEVKEEYRKLGIGTELYKQFGEIYNSDYNGWPVGRYFENSIAEYSFRKAIEKGWISDNSLTEQYIVRRKEDENQENWDKLRPNLSNEYKGPEQYAKNQLKRLIKK